MSSGANCSTLKLKNEALVENQIRKVLSNKRAFIHHGIGSLLRDSSTTQDQLLRQRALVYFLQESTAPRVCNFISCPNNVLE